MSVILNTTGYTYKDLSIVPKRLTSLKHRTDANCFVDETDYLGTDYLPIFTAPMSCVVNMNNYGAFESCGIHTIMPTTVSFVTRLDIAKFGRWVSMSMNEARHVFLDDNMKDWKNISNDNNNSINICVDVANGHMKHLLQLCMDIKSEAKKYGVNIKLMTGNIANPEVIWDYNEAGIDYVRVGIGGGSGCTTTSNTGCHYPMASLIKECYDMNANDIEHDHKVKIIADGGIRNYDDVTKALALGGDYVMIGGLFTQMLEAASDEYLKSDNGSYRKYDIVQGISECTEKEKRELISNVNIFHEVYGMSTKRAQSERGMENLKTSEGTHHFLPVKYTIHQWTENMISYLKSIMSYCNAYDLDQFIGNQTLIPNSPTTINSVNK